MMKSSFEGGGGGGEEEEEEEEEEAGEMQPLNPNGASPSGVQSTNGTSNQAMHRWAMLREALHERDPGVFATEVGGGSSSGRIGAL